MAVSPGRWLVDRAVLVFLAAFLVVRLVVLDEFMTHIDDVGVLVNLVDAEAGGLRAQVDAARQWTYAPAQVAVQAVLVRQAEDDLGVLFWGRLPSLLAWFAGLVLAHQLYREVTPGRPRVADLLVLVQAFSQRGLIESSQGYNYAATAPVAAAILTFFVREGARIQGELPPLGSLPRLALGRLVAAGLGLGALCWVTYQAPFLIAGGFLGLGLLMAARRAWGAIPRLALLGVLVAVPLSLVFDYHLKHVAHRGVAAWIPDPTPRGVVDLLGAWWRVVESVLTFLPWGLGSAVIAAMAVGALVAGATRRTALDDRARALLACALGVGAVFSAGALLGRIPLSPTRHAYVLQVPLLLTLAWGLDRLRLGGRLARGLAIAIVCVGLGAAASLQITTRRQLDVRAVEGIAAADSGVAVVGADGHHTWDHLLLLREHPEWRVRFAADDAAVRGPAATLPPRLLLLSHRARPTASLERLRGLGYTEVEVLQEVDPIGSTELVGDINGGNGGFIYLLRR